MTTTNPLKSLADAATSLAIKENKRSMISISGAPTSHKNSDDNSAATSEGSRSSKIFLTQYDNTYKKNKQNLVVSASSNFGDSSCSNSSQRGSSPSSSNNSSNNPMISSELTEANNKESKNTSRVSNFGLSLASSSLSGSSPYNSNNSSSLVNGDDQNLNGFSSTKGTSSTFVTKQNITLSISDGSSAPPERKLHKYRGNSRNNDIGIKVTIKGLDVWKKSDSDLTTSNSSDTYSQNKSGSAPSSSTSSSIKPICTHSNKKKSTRYRQREVANNYQAKRQVIKVGSVSRPPKPQVTNYHNSTKDDEDDNDNKKINDNEDTREIVSYNASKRVTFPLKLLDVLNRPDLVDVITWSENGKAWRVIDSKALEEHLPQYFKQSSYSSFIRQVQRWGFTRISDGKLKGFYYHDMFSRDKPDLCRWIQRVVKKKKPTKQTDEPDFYQMGNVENDYPLESNVANVAQPTSETYSPVKDLVIPLINTRFNDLQAESLTIPATSEEVASSAHQHQLIAHGLPSSDQNSHQLQNDSLPSSSSRSSLNADIALALRQLEQTRLQRMLLELNEELQLQLLAVQQYNNTLTLGGLNNSTASVTDNAIRTVNNNTPLNQSLLQQLSSAVHQNVPDGLLALLLSQARNNDSSVLRGTNVMDNNQMLINNNVNGNLNVNINQLQHPSQRNLSYHFSTNYMDRRSQNDSNGLLALLQTHTNNNICTTTNNNSNNSNHSIISLTRTNNADNRPTTNLLGGNLSLFSGTGNNNNRN